MFLICRLSLVLVTVLFLLKCALSQDSSQLDHAPEFSTYQVVNPRIFHGRDDIELLTTRKNQKLLEHVHDLVLKVNIKGEEHTVDLQLNRDLIPKNHFIRHQRDGSDVVHRPSPEEVELCQYQGKIRQRPGSWAAISTCSGIRGMIFDGEEMHYLEKPPGTKSSAIEVINEIDHHLYSHSDLIGNHSCGYEGTHEHLTSRPGHNRARRYKRSGEVIRGPYNANKRSRYVELILVVDNKIYKSFNQNLTEVHNKCKDIANIMNALYVPLNIFIALVGVVVWTDSDEITLSAKGDTTLTNFLHYRRERLVRVHPNDNAQLLTKVHFEGGVVGKALKGPICTYEFSGGVSMYHSNVVGLVATTVAHELGHNFGMEHDTSECQCPDDRCIMASSSSTISPTHWSSCSLEYLANAFNQGMDYCLRNKPERLFDSPVCGNGFVEAGEQCDCGLKNNCQNPCCNPTTCMLYSNATCATGVCCDLTTCHPKTAGTMCRTAENECDLPEYCTGQSEYCPGNVFKIDGFICDQGKAFCYQGTCRSHSDQCKVLWGPSGKSSDAQCYNMNLKGSRHGNCGYNRLSKTYIKCHNENIHCGMLHCQHLNEKLEFGMESVSILSHSFISAGGSVIPCRSAIVDLGLNEVDPGMAPDGARCGEGKMCVGQRCLAVGELLSKTNCENNCNGNGVCNSLGHCHCDAGFAPPFCTNPGIGGSEDSGPASQLNSRRDVINAFYIVFLGIVPFMAIVSLIIYYMKRNPIFLKQPRCKIPEKMVNMSRGRGPSPGSGKAYRAPQSGADITGPLIAADATRATLLPKETPNGDVVTGNLQNNMVGQFNGFTITPIRKSPEPPKPVSAPVRPCPKPPEPSRLVISSPILDATTSCTAKELIGTPEAKKVPTRPAPKAPEVKFYDKPLPEIPKPPEKPLPEKPRSEEKKSKEYPTLTRLASFVKGQDAKKDSKKKMDKDTLRKLEISSPIPQKEIAIPLATMPAGDNSVVMRAQSMRENHTAMKRGPIPSFGSMRSGKRPTSIPATVRPTSPPPPRPPSIGVPGYQAPSKPDNSYDDCLNLLTEGVAPLANIEEESPSSPKENIYAVIDESPVDQPPPPDIAPGTSAESLGLLSEIVSEIEARNTDSIYSASTMKKKKENSSTDDLTEDKSQTTYSPSSSNSGYLSPIQHIQKLPDPEPLAKPSPPPEVSVPVATYKPFSSVLQRNAGPLAASYRKSDEKTPPPSRTPSNDTEPEKKPPEVVIKQPGKAKIGKHPLPAPKPVTKPKPPVSARPKSESKVASLQQKFEKPGENAKR